MGKKISNLIKIIRNFINFIVKYILFKIRLVLIQLLLFLDYLTEVLVKLKEQNKNQPRDPIMDALLGFFAFLVLFIAILSIVRFFF